MTEVLILVAIVAGWFIVNRYIFPGSESTPECLPHRLAGRIPAIIRTLKNKHFICVDEKVSIP